MAILHLHLQSTKGEMEVLKLLLAPLLCVLYPRLDHALVQGNSVPVLLVCSTSIPWLCTSKCQWPQWSPQEISLFFFFLVFLRAYWSGAISTLEIATGTAELLQGAPMYMAETFHLLCYPSTSNPGLPSPQGRNNCSKPGKICTGCTDDFGRAELEQ